MNWFIFIIGCSPGNDPKPERPLAWPHAGLLERDRVAIDPSTLPQADTPVPTDHLGWRDGFSVVQSTVFDLGPMDSLEGVRLIDLETGEELPSFAELDAWPDNEEDPTLIVRPTSPLPVGHRVAAVVPTSVVEETDWWAWGPDLRDELSALGVEDLAMASSFPVGDGSMPTRAAVSMVETPTQVTWRSDVDDPEFLPEGIARRMEGTFTTVNFLVDDDHIELDDEGVPAVAGEVEAKLYVYVPSSIADAEPGTVPIWLYGHGIFSHPDNYLDQPDDPNGVVELANEAGVIVVATVWRGLTRSDLPVAISAGNDFARMRQLTDHLVQGVANTNALFHLVDSGGLDEDLDGLPSGVVRYYGISLGGIEGAVLAANTPELESAVFHVGGSAWSTMLERSANWTDFEVLVEYGVPSPRDRQQLYALSQLFWDPVDPALYGDDLADRAVLWQESIGDEQVPNRTTELLARAAGAVQMTPSVYAVEGLEQSDAPTAPALVQFDPELPLPPDVNRPAERTGAHGAPRHWPGSNRQTARFNDPEDPGVVEHYCGEEPCSASNPGSWE